MVPVLISFDYESYYAANYSLTTLSYTDYIFHKDFHVHGAAYVVDGGDSGWLDHADIPAFLSAHKDDTFLFHNAQFDVSVMYFVYGFVPRKIIDTLALARLYDGFIQPGLDLDHLATVYGVGGKGSAIADFKGVVTLEGELKQRVVEYAINDATITLRLFKKMLAKYRELFHEGVLRREMRLIDATMKLVVPQLKLDGAKLDKAILEEKYKAQESYREMADFVGLPVAELLNTVRSRSKFSDLLTRLGVATPTKVSKRTGKVTQAFAKGDDKFVKLIEAYEGTPIGQLLVLKRDASSTIRATRSQRFATVNEQCGGLPIYLNYAGAQQTLRFSGGNKMNAQNLPRNSVLRESVVPPDGYKLVIADFSAIEARGLAWEAGDQELLTLFHNGEDVYVDAASKLWSDVIGPDGKPDKIKRFVGKAQILALGYGAGWSALEAVLRLGALGTIFTFSPEQAHSIVSDCSVIKEKLRKLYTDNRDKFDGYAFLLERNPDLLWHFAACDQIVSTYRAERPAITDFWGQASPKRLVRVGSGSIGEHVNFTDEGDGCILHLPGGTKLVYHNLRQSEDSGNFVYTLAGETKYTYGGKIVENITQAIARNVMAAAWEDCLDYGLPRTTPVWSVHDELVFLAREDEAQDVAKLVKEAMVREREWAVGFPLGVKVEIADSYAEK